MFETMPSSDIARYGLRRSRCLEEERRLSMGVGAPAQLCEMSSRTRYVYTAYRHLRIYKDEVTVVSMDTNASRMLKWKSEAENGPFNACGAEANQTPPELGQTLRQSPS
jgi:hypothetical protein